MKYLSIWENPGEVLDFLSKWDFITPDEATEDYDLLKWFEGDPDWLELGNNYKCYFTGFHPGTWK